MTLRADDRVQLAFGSSEEVYRMLRSGKVDEAVRLADALVSAHPHSIDALVIASDARLAADDAEAALDRIVSAIALTPGDLKLLQRKAHVLMALMRRQDARKVASEIAAQATAEAMWTAGRIYSRSDDPADAEPCLSKALELGQQDPSLRYEIATAQYFLGKFEAAEENLDACLEQAPGAGEAMYLRSTLRRQTPERNHVRYLEDRFRAGIRNPAEAAACLYALAKELEDLGRWDDSFSALAYGAALKRRSLQYDAAAELKAIEGIRLRYSSDVLSGTRGHSEEGPIFVVGMPRSGTTLVERILTRHSKVTAVGELPYFAGCLAAMTRHRMRHQPVPDPLDASLELDFRGLGERYIQGARQAMLASAPIFVDKMPVNFLYCGLIRKALPKARIVHLVRHPMDTCYAVFRALFQQAYFFSYDLLELADYYLAYRRLMDHWHAAMPGAILDVSYEELVTDPEIQARRILSWCGLEWEEHVLDPDADARPSTTASAAQVRRPINTASIGKSRHYSKGLEPLRLKLAAAGVISS